jgi:DNA-binding MarR family transcriptional regulator
MPSPRSQAGSRLFSQSEYEKLAEFRYQLARFLRRRMDAARAEGLQPQQYEMLLAVAGLPAHRRPTIKEIAGQLRLEHHTVVELADRLEVQGLLSRRTSADDKRAVLVRLTPSGRAVLGRIVRFSYSQLRDEGPTLIRSLRRLLDPQKRS